MTDNSIIINDSNVDDTTWENAIRFSVSRTQSPATSKKSKERPQLSFSVAAFDESMESTADTTPLESTLNESRNGTNVSDGLNWANILQILQKNAPSGYKYCLTLVPRNVSAKKVNPATGAEAPKPTQCMGKLSQLRNTKKISETQKKLATGAKKKRKREINQLNHKKTEKVIQTETSRND